ncbi:facilitated trehalose transporter Tret1-like [Hylaeus volcanicus]|uniref:facilitated trehalose transporter Tret1-like n=1 Tax=Hylaeus volcanicus TaxID=313075 RepID=UPI0023B7DDC4|nr:facilitated trehalose transporter Tret1-like [Hylaeus volcanicus]
MEKNCGQADASDLRLRVRQLLTALSPLLGIFLVGLASGYSAVLLPQLKVSTDDEDFERPTVNEQSWIASSPIPSMAPGCWLSGVMLEKIGRRKSTALAYPLFFIGWTTIGFAPDIASLLVGRIITGFCSGIMGAVTPIYIGETSDPDLRGMLLNMVILTLSFGILAVHALGTWLYWRTTAYICAGFAAISSLICIAAKESPTWLINKGRTDQARESWIYLRGWKSLDEYQALENSRTRGRKTVKRSFYVKLRTTFTSRFFLWPLGLMCLFFFTAQFSGYNVVVYYSVELLMEVTGPENAHVGTLVVDVIRLVTSAITCYLIKKRSRRTMTFVSGFGSAIALFLLSLSIYFEFGKPWCSCVALLLYIVFSTMGLLPLPWILTGELFPRKLKGLGSGIATGFSFMSTFAVVKIAPGMILSLQQYGTFAIYGLVALVGTCILYLTLPETKDKTLQEIEMFMARKTNRVDVKSAEQADDRGSN